MDGSLDAAKTTLDEMFEHWVIGASHQSNKAEYAMSMFKIKAMTAEGEHNTLSFVTSLEDNAAVREHFGEEYTLQDVPTDSRLIHHEYNSVTTALNYILVVFSKNHLMNDDTCRIDDDDLDVKFKRVLGCVCAMHQLVLNLYAVSCFVGEEMYHQKTPLKGLSGYITGMQEFSNWDKDFKPYQLMLSYAKMLCSRFNLRKLNGKLYQQVKVRKCTRAGMVVHDNFTRTDEQLTCKICQRIKKDHNISGRRADHAFQCDYVVDTDDPQIFDTCAWSPIGKEFEDRFKSIVVTQVIGGLETPPADARVISFLRSMIQRTKTPGQWKNMTDSAGNTAQCAAHLIDSPMPELPILKTQDGSWSFLNGVYITTPPKAALHANETTEKVCEGGGRFFPYEDIQSEPWIASHVSSKFLAVWFDDALMDEEIDNTEEVPYLRCATCLQEVSSHDEEKCIAAQKKHQLMYRDRPRRPGTMVWHTRNSELVQEPVWNVLDGVMTTRNNEVISRDSALAHIGTISKTIEDCVRCRNSNCAVREPFMSGDLIYKPCTCGDPMTTTRKPNAWYAIKTPFFQAILDDQYQRDNEYFTTDEKIEGVCRMIYVMLGRMFFKLKKYDNWQVVFMIKGQAASGKSTIGQIVQHYFEADDVCVLSTNCQTKFGGAALIDRFTRRPKKLSLCLEVKKNFGQNFEQGMFQSIVAGETVAINIKNKDVCQIDNWDRPMFLLGNELPDYQDTSNSIARRFIMAQFDAPVPEGKKDGKLLERIFEREGAALIVKCITAYQSFASKYGAKILTGIDDSTRKAILPRYFKLQQDKMRKNTHRLLGFLKSNDNPTALDIEGNGSKNYDCHPKFYCSYNKFTQDFKAWVTRTHGREKGSKQTCEPSYMNPIFKLLNITVHAKCDRLWVNDGGEQGFGMLKGTWLHGVGIIGLMVGEHIPGQNIFVITEAEYASDDMGASKEADVTDHGVITSGIRSSLDAIGTNADLALEAIRLILSKIDANEIGTAICKKDEYNNYVFPDNALQKLQRSSSTSCWDATFTSDSDDDDPRQRKRSRLT